MKIGIVTQPLKANYGGFLQAWALQEQLRKMGHEPITIDYLAGPTPWWILVRSWVKTLLLFCIGKRRPFGRRSPAMERIEMFDKFVRKNMNVTEHVKCYTPKLVDQYGLEAVITGSDQVWRPMYNTYLKDMFLQFVRKPGVRRIAYAASFGVDNWEYRLWQTVACRRLAQRLDAISVRENSGIALCRKYLGVDAIEVLDPTLLHTKEDYEKLCADVPKTEEPYLASYVLDLTTEKQTFIENIAKELGLKVRIFSADKDAELSIEEWLAIYRDAEFVVTDSFHGTVFSILFNKPFLSIVNEGRGASRFHSLLGKLGLENMLIHSLEQRLLPFEFNWKNVNAKLEALRIEANKFLFKALQ